VKNKDSNAIKESITNLANKLEGEVKAKIKEGYYIRSDLIRLLCIIIEMHDGKPIETDYNNMDQLIEKEFTFELQCLLTLLYHKGKIETADLKMKTKLKDEIS